MSKLQKMLIGAAGASALALSISPAMARDYARDNDDHRYERNDGHDRYERNGRYNRHDRYNRYNRYDRRGRYYRHNRYDRRRYNHQGANYRGGYNGLGSNHVVKDCISAVKRHLRRSGRVDVTGISNVRRARYGNLRVSGRLVLQTRYGDDYGRFTCKTDGYGRPSLSFRGLWDGR